MSILVFDIGGTTMRMGVGESHTLHHVEKVPTPHTPEEAIAALVAYAGSHALQLERVVGGIAGYIGHNIVHTSPHLPAWKEFPFAIILEERLMAPVHIYNDAEMAALGEAVHGAGKGHRLVAYIGIGTGIGGALVDGGHVAPRAEGFEPGHQIVQLETGETLEDLAGGAALRARFGMGVEKLPLGTLDAMTPALATGLYNSILAWSPDILVLGGSLMNDETGYRIEHIRTTLQAFPSMMPLPPVVPALLGDENGLYGALVQAHQI